MSGYRIELGGLITCQGGMEDTWQGVLEGDISGLRADSSYIPGKEVKVGRVNIDLPPLPTDFARYDCRIHRILFAAAQEMKQRIDLTRFDPTRVAVVLGSSTAGIASTEDEMFQASLEAQSDGRFHFMKHELGRMSQFVAELVGAEGPSYTLSTACSSSAKVFNSARRLLRTGLADAVIVGGADSLCRLTVNGFNALALLSKDVPNPLSKNRDGIVIGEGAALFLMTKEGGGIRLLGIGESSDAYHMSSPHPEGLGAEIAIREALQEARCTPDDINYINLHATGTKHNDLAESIAINSIFGEDVLCSSTKAVTGHTLGAGGAIEAAICYLVLAGENFVPPHVWDGVRDGELAPLRVACRGDVLPSGIIHRSMSNSFAFGGSNCVLIFGRE